MPDNQFDKLRQQAEGQSSGGIFKKTTYPSHHELVSGMPPLREPTDIESIYNNIELTMSHIIRDIMMPITISPPSGATLAERDYHALMAGMAVYPMQEEKIYRLATRLPRILLNYFLYETSYYSRVMIESIDLIVESKPSYDEAGHGYVEVMLADHSRHKLPVMQAVAVRGIGSDALREELFALFRLRQQIFRGISNIAKNSHKVVVTVTGLTALMAEASKDTKLLSAVQNEINQQVLSIFNDSSEVAIVDKNTEIGSFKMEVAQLGDQMDFIYTELARILQIPKTKLLGESPTGLSATGEFDYKNYQDMLESVRVNVVYPLLSSMEIHYDIATIQDMGTVNQAIASVVLAEQQLSNLRTEGLYEIYKNTIGSNGLGLVSDENINVVLMASDRYEEEDLYHDR